MSATLPSAATRRRLRSDQHKKWGRARERRPHGPGGISSMDAQHATRDDGSTVLHLDDHERQTVAEIVALDRTTVGEQVGAAETSAALQQAITRVQLHARLMLAAETGVLPIDEAVLDAVRDLRDDNLQGIQYERDSLAKLKAGNEKYCFCGMTPEESEVETARIVDMRLDELSGCNSILDRAEAL